MDFYLVCLFVAGLDGWLASYLSTFIYTSWLRCNALLLFFLEEKGNRMGFFLAVVIVTSVLCSLFEFPDRFCFAVGTALHCISIQCHAMQINLIRFDSLQFHITFSFLHACIIHSFSYSFFSFSLSFYFISNQTTKTIEIFL